MEHLLQIVVISFQVISILGHHGQRGHSLQWFIQLLLVLLGMVLELMITMTTMVTQSQCHPPGLHILISIVLINATRDQPATNGMRQRRITNKYTLRKRKKRQCKSCIITTGISLFNVLFLKKYYQRHYKWLSTSPFKGWLAIIPQALLTSFQSNNLENDFQTEPTECPKFHRNDIITTNVFYSIKGGIERHNEKLSAIPKKKGRLIWITRAGAAPFWGRTTDPFLG